LDNNQKQDTKDVQELHATSNYPIRTLRESKCF